VNTQWFCIPLTPHSTPTTSISLTDIVQWIADEPVLRSLSRLTLVEAAENIAEGIMQFYSTPWLAPANLSQNLRCFNSADPTAAAGALPQLCGPYFLVRMDSRQIKGKGREQRPGLASMRRQDGVAGDVFSSSSGPRNELLFNFGIILLEIGYGRPWQDLKESVAKSGDGLSDYRAAEKLAHNLVGQMGQAYPRIIKKCLGCDFGLGETDLNNEDLQRRFLEDVVSALHHLREQMGQLHACLGMT
jgi:hypothetical protein